MHEGIAAAIIIAVIFGGIVGIISTILNYMLKRKLLDSGQLDEKSIHILGAQEEGRYSALKWGLVILFGGIALVLLEFIPYHIDSPFPYGLVATFVSAGFLVYYFIVKKEIS